MCTDRGSKQGPLGPKSDALTTAPPYVLRKCIPKLNVLFTNKKIISVGSSEVHCSKSMEKSEVIQKSYNFTLVE